MKRLSPLLAAVALGLLGLASPAHGAFGITGFSNEMLKADGAEETQAGAHPYAQEMSFTLNTTTHPVTGEAVPDENTRELRVDLPVGFVGNPNGISTCGTIQLSLGVCPVDSQIGIVVVDFAFGSVPPLTAAYSVFNMVPGADQVARFAFNPGVGAPINIVARVRSDFDYGVTAGIVRTPEGAPFTGTRLTLWGVPADPSHDSQRGSEWFCLGDLELEPESCTGGGHSVSSATRAFLTNPTSCGGPLTSAISADSWQTPGVFSSLEYTSASGMTGCDALAFEPSITVRPTNSQADSPTGLDVDLAIPQNNNPAGFAAAHVKDSVVRLPEGMSVNPAAADGLLGCSEADFGLHAKGVPSCPDASKIGTVEIESELVRAPLRGSIYQAKQFDNPSGSLIAFYTHAKGPGLEVKLAARVVTDPVTGRVTTIFEDSPQLPFDHYRLHFNGGPRAPLRTPPTCGVKTAEGAFTSWAAPATEVEITDSFQITSGPGGGPCANTLAERPHAPGLSAGSVNPLAGAFSPFVLDVSRADGTQELRTIEATLPQGMLGKLAGIPDCPESAVGSISSAPGSGLGERLGPSCPPASLIGHTDAAAGAGPLPFHNPGNVYLTGPRGGAPLSLAIVTPVVGGPLDLGSVVVRADLQVDPVTAQIRAVSDPLPSILEGIPLNLRSVRVTMDRDRFTLNPTSCEEMRVHGTIGSLQGASASVSERFQVGGCAALGFKPKLGLRLFGKTRRGAHPKLRVALQMPDGGANIERATVALPRSVFLDQANIRTVCTRVQYAAKACPAGAVYGYAVAKSPLLDEPLRGPVYLRSSTNELPDLVASLDGQIHIDLAGRIDSVGGGGIRTSFELVPDAPVSKFVLTMKGGGKGLLVNSRSLCRRTYRATANFDAHSGKIHDLRPRLRTACAKTARARPPEPAG